MSPEPSLFPPSRGTYDVMGADGSVIAIAPGDWFINSKARAELMAKIRLSEDARKVYACLELATMGYKQEVAVTMEGGKKRLLTTADIARQTALSERYVRYALTELEEKALGDRRAVDGGALRKGKVEILSWALPRPVEKPTKPDIAAARCRIPEWFPDSWDDLAPFVKRMKLHLPADIAAARGLNPELIARGDAAARCLKEAENEVRAVVDAVCALAFQEPYKEKGTERNSERNNCPEPESFAEPEKSFEEESNERTNSIALVVTAPNPEPTPVRSSGPFSIKELLRAWLVGKFPLPTGLPPDILERIAQHIPDELVFEQFCLAAEQAKPNTWMLFIRIAAACEANRERYAAIMREGPQVRKSPGTQAALDLMQRRIARGEAPL